MGHGVSNEFSTVEETCRYLAENVPSLTFTDKELCEYHIVIRYSNEDTMEVRCKDRQTAIATLKSLPMSE